MSAYPVRYSIDRPPGSSRLQVLIRIAAFLALGMLGVSFGSVFAFAFVALPVLAASRLATRGPAYLREEGPSVVEALRWVAAIGAWAGLIAERLPRRTPEEVVTLTVEPRQDRSPTAKSAIARLFTGLPSAIVLMLLCCLGAFVWIWAALSILVVQRIGSGAFEFLVGLQRWSVRLLAYQASLVDEYPPFSLSEEPPVRPDTRIAT